MNGNFMADSLSFDRDEMTEGEKQLFLRDFKRVYDEYFEGDGKPDINLTRTEDGFSVCIIFSASRVKRFKRV